jgi:hypothetical protein
MRTVFAPDAWSFAQPASDGARDVTFTPGTAAEAGAASARLERIASRRRRRMVRRMERQGGVELEG